MRMRIRWAAPLAAAVAVLALALGAVSFAALRHRPHHARSARTLFAVLSGRNEISPTGQRRAGDPDAFGSATVLVKGAHQICFGITVAKLDHPTLAHIHRGPRGINGPVVVTLVPPSSGDPGASSGCVTGVDSQLTRAIRRHPSRYYVNVHTDAFPSGAVRGQLFAVNRHR